MLTKGSHVSARYVGSIVVVISIIINIIIMICWSALDYYTPAGPPLPSSLDAVCQAQKQVRCERAGGGEKCEVEKEVTTKAICEYSTELWQAGGTCIVDVLSKQQESSPK